jgi:hypothetical protein
MVLWNALQVASAAAANAEQFLCFGALLSGTANASQAFPEGYGDSAGHAFASFFSESLREFVSFRVFDVQAH